MRPADELRDAVEATLRALPLHPDLGDLLEPMRYALQPGGKRIRPVLCLAVAEAAGGTVEHALHAAAAVELVHTFSLVHDDLPALDDDDERRGRPSVHVAFGDGVALLAGDALLAEAFRLAMTYEGNAVAAELADATLGMIGGQYRDVTGDSVDIAAVHRLKTGRLFVASVRMGLEVAGVPDDEREPWLRFGDDIGRLFQAVDDLLDGDGYVERIGRSGTEVVAHTAARGARRELDDLSTDTSVLVDLVDVLAVRTG